MRILHVLPSFGLGGMEKIVCALINNTSECYTHEILALNKCTKATNWIKEKKIKLVHFEKPKKRAKFFRNLYRILQQIQPEVLMTYNWGASDAIWLGRLAGVRCIIHNEHGFNIDEVNTTHRRRDVVRFLVYRLASKVIVVSRELESLLQQRYLLKPNHIIRIPNGIDSSYYAPDGDERERMRKRLGFEHDAVVVGFSGRLDPIKRLDLLLDIFACCVREHSHLRLLIVGDGPEKKRLETLCRERNLIQVVFTGEQENVLSYLRAMDIFLTTSRREQMPMTVLEAMGVGIPVLTTKVGELPHIVDDGGNGFVVDARTEVFSELLRALLCPARRKNMGEAAREKIVNQFQEQAMVERYKTAIQELR